jgi:Raf kinase inhibitor-like YbhB/YbcL family protein
MQHVLLLGLALTACSSASRMIDAPDMVADSMTLTSTAFAEGGTIPVEQTCRGMNQSPPLAWTGAPSGTQSIAVVLTDLAVLPPLVHWVIYDLSPSATGLPGHIEASYQPASVPGAHQTRGYDDRTFGYLGPCPAVTDRYVFTVHALDVAVLPGARQDTTAVDAAGLVTGHHIARGTLSGLYGP